MLGFVGFEDDEGSQVLVGTDLHQLEGDGSAHLYPGVLVSVLAADEEAPLPYTLGQLLLSPYNWSEAYCVPEPASDTAYILVYRGQEHLHFVDSANPTGYRTRYSANHRS